MPNPDHGALAVVLSEQEFSSLLCGSLADAGLFAAEYRDGRDALRHFQNCSPDLVVTDVDLDGMDGMEFIVALQELVPAPDVLLCTNTRRAREWSQSDLERLNIKAAIVRPIKMEALVEAAKQLLTEDR